jgi:hypothetical protein
MAHEIRLGIMKINNKYPMEHQIFSDLKRFTGFYDQLSNSVLQFSTIGTNVRVNIDSYFYSSIQGTLESMQEVLKNERITDAYALLRQYYDSVIINVYTNLYLKINWDPEKFIAEKSGNSGKIFIEHIDNWFHGKKSLPAVPKMKKYIFSSTELNPINELFLDEHYTELIKRCNGIRHYNSFGSILLNDPRNYVGDHFQRWHSLCIDVQDIFILHMGYIFFLKPHYMGSSDYYDSLESGRVPEENSQYWVASFIQSLFDEIISPKRPEITAVIKQFSPMHLDFHSL